MPYRVMVLAAAVALAGCERAEAAARRSAEPTRAQRNARCVRCHERAAQTWSTSLHRRSWTEADFASAREPDPFCRSCHAPEGDPSAPPSPEAADIGVACVTCHVPPGSDLPPHGVLAGPEAARGEASPHPLVRDPTFASGGGCGGCHEFESMRQRGFMMQTTVTEHARSPFSEHSCASCHMPRGDHGFAASRDPGVLRSAVSVTAARPAPDVVVLTLEPGRIGHAFPTGDPFRALTLELDAVTPEGLAPIERRTLRRELRTHRVGFFKEAVEDADTRIGGEDFQPTHRFSLGDAKASRVAWRLTYARLDVAFGDDAPRVFDRVVLYEGTLP